MHYSLGRTIQPLCLFAALACVALPACEAEHFPERNPPGGGPGVGGNGSDPDAAVSESDAGPPGSTRLSGTVCRVTDLRAPTECLALDVSDVTIGVVGSSAQTMPGAGGAFELDFTADSVVVKVTGDSVRTGLVPIQLGTGNVADVAIPAIDLDYWNAVIGQTIIDEPVESASIVVYLIEDKLAALGAEVTAPPGTLIDPYYDRNDALSWSRIGLAGAEGVALLFGVPTDAPTVTLTVTNNGGSIVDVVSGIPVAAGQTTFVTHRF